MIGTLLIVLLVVLIIGGLPHYPYSAGRWGYGPSGFFGIVLIIIVILLLMGRI